MKKFVFFLLIVAIIVPNVMAGGGSQAAATTYTLRSSTNLAASGTVGMGLTKFVELVNERAGGRIKATANFGNELGGQAEQVQMTRGGSLEMVVSAPGTGLGTYVPQFGALALPFIFQDNDHFLRVLKSMEGEISRLVQPFGFVARGGQSMGSRHMLSVTPIKKLSDMKGLKMRGPDAVYAAMFTALGATGTTTDWNEIYTGFQSRMIDGMEASPSMINSMKFQDVAKNMTITNHIIACIYYFFNEKWLNSLPADLKELVLKCADDAAAYQAVIDVEDQEKAQKSMIAGGLNVIELKDLDAWKAACGPMINEFKAKGPEWADFIGKMQAIK